MRKTTCKGCGRVLLLDDEKLQISHESPECETFKDLINKAIVEGFGPKESRVTVLDPDTGKEIK